MISGFAQAEPEMLTTYKFVRPEATQGTALYVF